MSKITTPAQRLRRRTRWALGKSTIWLFLGSALALSVPTIGLLPHALLLGIGGVAFAITLLLIVGNLNCAIRIVGRTGRTIHALPLTFANYLLFTLLFVQVLCHFGAERYRWKNLPGPDDWFAFTAAHAIRAGDILDVVEAYQFNIQAIQHHSALVAVLLVFFHLVMGLFFLSLIGEWLSKLRRAFLSFAPFRYLFYFIIMLFILAVGAMVMGEQEKWAATAKDSTFSQRDFILWPIEDILRLLDFADVMILFHIHFHELPNTTAIATLSITFRLIVGLLIAGYLHRLFTRISLRRLDGIGLSPADLREVIQKHPDEEVRELATRRINEINHEPIYGSRSILTFGMLLVPLALLFGISKEVPTWPGWDRAVVRLVEGSREPATADAAFASLQRMGPYAASAIPLLTRAPQTESYRERVIGMLGYLGPQAGPILDPIVISGDGRLDRIAAASLCHLGPVGVPWMIWGLESPDAEVRRILEANLLALDDLAIAPILEVLNITTAARAVPILERIDPYWFLRTHPAKNYQRVQNARTDYRDLYSRRYQESEYHYLHENDFCDLGLPITETVLRELMQLQRVKGPRFYSGYEMIGRTGAAAQCILTDLIAELPQAVVLHREQPLGFALDRIDPNWHQRPEARQIRASLQPDLNSTEETTRQRAERTLAILDQRIAPQFPIAELCQFIIGEKKLPDIASLKGIEWARGELVRHGAEAIPALMILLPDKRFQVREDAQWVLLRIGKPAIPALLAATDSPETNARVMAAQVLDELHPYWELRFGRTRK